MDYSRHIKMALKDLEAAVMEAAQDDSENSGVELVMTHLQALDDLIDYVFTKED